MTTILSVEDMKEVIQGAFENRISFGEAKKWIEKGFAIDDSQLWRDVMKKNLNRLIDEFEGEIKTKVIEEINDAIME